MANEFENFYNELNHTIERKTRTIYPIMGVIHEVSIDREYADVKTESGIISNIPAHGFPVVGDSCIIHFINGNVEQPVCDCARRLAPPTEQYMEMMTSDCFNYHTNGDFNNKKEGYEGNFELKSEGDPYITTGNYYCELADGQYIQFKVDISECNTKYFKFQANMRGQGFLQIDCYDKNNKRINPVPENLGKTYSVWASEEGRFGWSFNKEAYLREDNTEVTFKITNITGKLLDEDLPTVIVGGEERKVPHSISIDGILVYDENASLDYYWSKEDMQNNIK